MPGIQKSTIHGLIFLLISSDVPLFSRMPIRRNVRSAKCSTTYLSAKSTELATSSSNVTFGCLPGWELIGKHCYYFATVSLDFEDAIDVCDKYGAKLLVVRDEVEAKNVSSRYVNDHFWIYNGRDVQDGSSNSSLNNTFCEGLWQPNEPRVTNEDVAIASNDQGRWALKWIWMNLPFVCRAPACPEGSFRCSDGACLNKKWQCDGVYDCRDYSDENNCKDRATYYSTSSGTADLTSGSGYQWTIEGQPGEVLKIEFETLTIEDYVNSVRVYTGGPSIMTSELIEEVRISQFGNLTLFGRNHFLIVTLTTGTTGFKASIKFIWTADSEVSRKPVEKVTVTDVDMTISSPNFSSPIMPRSFKMEWLLMAPEGQLITLEILENTFEMNTHTDVYIVTNVGFVLKELNTNRAIYVSSKNSMSVIIKTNSGKRLFKARYRTGCNFSTKLSLATFSILDLPVNLACFWNVTNELGTDFRLRIDKSYFDDSHDFLQLRGRTLATVNTSSVELQEFKSLSDDIYLKYFSDLVLPGNKIEGKILADCPDIRNMSNINVTYSNSSEAGKIYTANITCAEGFTFKQEEYSRNKTIFAVCREGGMWDWGSPSYTRTPECQAVYCGFPPRIPNGFVTNIGGNVTYKGIATYQCFTGFVIIGSLDIMCEANGSWSQAPSCDAEGCTDVPKVANATYNITFGDESKLSTGTIVKYTCNPGFDLLGSQKIVCLSNKTWSHEPPLCKKLTCSLPMMEHGQYTFQPSMLPEFGDAVSLSCDSGYQINRTMTQNDTSIICGINRTLSVENDVCVDVNECNMTLNNCSANEDCVNKPGSYSCVCKSGYNGTNCADVDECALNICHQNCTNLDGSYYCTCQEGYNLYTKNGTNGFYIPAGEDGLKSGDVFQINNTCVPISCDKGPELPEHARALMVKSSYIYNETVDIICDFGYKIEGSSFATCQSNGNWTYNSIPICKNSSCVQPVIGKHEAFRLPASGDIEPLGSLIITCNLNDGSGNTTNRTMFCAPSPDDSGNFSLQGDDPKCPEIDCGKLLNIPGANQSNVTDTTFGSSFEFDCDINRGFKKVGESSLGNSTVICQSVGRWGYGNLTCEGSRCKDPGTKGGTNQIVKTSYEIDQTVHYNCTRPGFTPVPNDTLVCEYKNGNASWSGDPPTCEDTEPPLVNCPSVEPFDLYDLLIYPNPNMTDNSGISCFMIQSGPPSGVSVVSKNLTVKYKATDSRNDAFCEFNVTVKDRTEPTLICPNTIQGNISEIFNLTEALLISDSGDGKIMFDPEGPITLTAGSIVPVRVNITKDNGLVKECAFLISTVSMICMNDSLIPPENGRIESCAGDDSQMTCTVVCNDGYVFQEVSNTSSYSCTNGKWETKLPLKPCIKLSDPTFDFDVTLQYIISGAKVPPNAQYDRDLCLASHYSLLSNLVESMSACGYNNFTAVSVNRSREINSSTDEIKFTLQLLINDGNETTLESCATTLLNQSVTLFGPTYPSAGSITCLSPWVVKSSDGSIVPKNFSCSNITTMVEYNSRIYCLPCGPGTLFNSTSMKCQECLDGFYQNEEGQTMCKQCPSGVFKSHLPRTRESHCFELCPGGFTSANGYLEDNCTQCPENQFSKYSNSCQPCPNNGSTLGVSGAVSEAQCSDPCPPGQYSITGYLPCSVCPQHFYSDNPGVKECTECLSNEYTKVNRSTSKSDCLNGSSLCTANFCTASGTKENTVCEIIDHRPVCICKPGYYGDSCTKSCDICSPNPCYNEGTCTQIDGFNFTCTCKTENNCTFEMNKKIQYTTDPTVVTFSNNGSNECRNLCLSNITCVAYLVESGRVCYQYNKLLIQVPDNKHESYTKHCSMNELFDGPLCEQDLVNDCNDTVCTNLDFCMDLVGDTECQCPQVGNYDSKCAQLDDPCQGNNCSQHGRCIPFGSVRSVCECDPGYTGDTCEIDINECELNPNGCLYNGTCENQNNMYNCSCVSGFSGTHCEILADFCFRNECKVEYGSICTNDYQNLTASCTCGENYMRDQQKPDVCTPKNYCVSNPCVNGTCVNNFGGFNCNCNIGFEGSLCQHNTDDCINHTCQNGASCKDMINNYMCECPVGFRGLYCEENINDCNGSCVDQHVDSVCKDLIADFQCECKSAFSGKNCSDNVDECSVYEPCLHGGNCSDFYGGYNCSCPTGWKGDNCETEMIYCSSDPCKNMGVCHNLVDNYYCQCQDGTAGKNCELTEEICAKFNDSVCSVDGKCEYTGGLAQCQCLEDYSGEACEFQKDHCINNPCNGGICTLSNLTYECDCSNVKNYVGKNCSEKKNVCNMCPPNIPCREYLDQEGYLRPACMCAANETLAGNRCKIVEKNFDLAFLENFAGKKTFVTSERGFYLEKNTSLSVTMWVAAAKKLNSDSFILALRSSDMRDPFLSIFNTKVQFETNITVELSQKDGLKHSLDESFTWHFISVVWSADGNLEILFDYIQLNRTIIPAVPPTDQFVFVQLGQSFYGYISQVSVWKSTLSLDECLKIFENKLDVPQMDNLLLGWTFYSYDESVQRTNVSTAVRSISVCNISNTIAKMGLDSSECKSKIFTDKTPPKFNFCNESVVIPTSYAIHQVSSSILGYEYTDQPGDLSQSPEKQFFSYGAYDIAVTATDVEGNIGVCMTRAYITPNKCSDTEPSQNYTDTCSGNSNGRKVMCPNGMMPSVPTSNFITCGKLQTYNLDNMYEKPDRIVCGVSTPMSKTVNLKLPYIIQVDCDNSILSSFNTTLKSKIIDLNKKWPGLCSDQNCSNVVVNGSCSGLRNVTVHILISGVNESLTSSVEMLTLTPEELMTKLIAEKTEFDVMFLANAQFLSSLALVNVSSSCEAGYSLSGKYCVQCGPGSYYDVVEKNCKLCELNKYSDQSGNISCADCPANNVTLQRGSSNITDCKDKCLPGQMLNVTTDKCVPCPKNFYQDQEGKSYCFPCPPSTGTENNGSKSVTDCIDFCPPGTELKGQDCVECQRGYYRPGNLQDSCTQCPLSNFTTKGNGSISENDCNIPKCEPGHFVNAGNGSMMCQPCDYGSYQPDEAQFGCLPCNVNFTTEKMGAANASMCHSVIAGLERSVYYNKACPCCLASYLQSSVVCPAGHEEYPPDSQQCVSCKRGYYRSEDFDQRFENCTICPSGNTTLKEGSTYKNECIIPKCEPGQFIHGNDSLICQKCDYGSYQPDEAQFGCLSCNVNFTTEKMGTANASMCRFVCPAGHEEYPPDSQQCVSCKRGYYRSEDFDQRFENCTMCPSGNTTLKEGSTYKNECIIPICMAGTYLNVTEEKCFECPLNFYQDEILQEECKQCPNNSQTQMRGAVSMDNCTFVCPPGFEVDSSGKNCTLCPRGTYKNESMKFESCKNCSSNMTTEYEGITDLALCNIAKCLKGYKVSADNKTCEKCSIGTFQDMDMPFSTTVCEMCPQNTTTETEASTSIKECFVHCEPGFYSENNITCMGCPSGFYKNESGNHNCTECPNDVTSDGMGKTSVSDCYIRKCLKGQFRNSTNDCQECDFGFYQDMEGQTSCNNCSTNYTTMQMGSDDENDCRIICQAGNYRNESSNSCFPCLIGTYQDLPGKNACIPCMDNYTTSSEGSTLHDQCFRFCPQGYYRSGADQCVPCSVGEYQNLSDQMSCRSCGTISGYKATTFSTASTKDTDCYPTCSEGLYLNMSMRSCVLCTMGFYKNQTNLNTSCHPCNNNLTTANNGATSFADCSVKKCGKSYFLEHSSNTCKMCPVGKFQTADPYGNAYDCTPCQDNTTTLIEGAPAETYCIMDCPAGQEYKIRSKRCFLCPVGQYRPVSIMAPPTCLYCPTGSTTLSQGESSCLPSPSAVLPSFKITISVEVTFKAQECGNKPAIVEVIKNIINTLLQNHNNNRYRGLCSGACNLKVDISVLNVCGDSSRRKRQMDDTAKMKVVVYDVDAILSKNDGSGTRSSVAALEEAFYDIDPVQEDLTRYKLTLVSAIVQDCGQSCVIDSDGYAQLCTPGQFSGTNKCEPCAKGSYSTYPVSRNCSSCPNGQSTKTTGAQNITFCDGACAFDPSYCGSKGTCKINAYGMHYCECNSGSTGPACSERQIGESTNMKLVIGISVGIGGLLMVLLLIFGICAYKRRQRSKQSSDNSQSSESELPEYKYPVFHQPVMWTDPTMYSREVIDM